MSYTTTTPMDEPIEIRLHDTLDNKMSYLGTLCDNGALRHSLTGHNGVGWSMSYAGLEEGQLPRKAVPGWQKEVLDLFRSANRTTITEVR